MNQGVGVNILNSKAWWFLFALLMSLTVQAQTENTQKTNTKLPHEVVEEVTEKLLVAVENSKSSSEKDQGTYFSDVRVIMEDAINFKFIAKNVMGKYWSVADREQKHAFLEVFTMSMVETYAKGMANFANLDITTIPSKDGAPEFGKANVMQKIVAADGINRVAYTMGKRKGGEWQLINVVLDGINLGQQFRTQFAQLVEENNGDINLAIENWSQEG